MVDLKPIAVANDLVTGIPASFAAGERCAIPMGTFQQLGFGNSNGYDFTQPGNRPQIRVSLKTDMSKSALFTVAGFAATEGVIELGPRARTRWKDELKLPLNGDPLDTADLVTIHSNVFLPASFSEHGSRDPRSLLVVIAPHGQDVEKHTGTQAAHMATSLRNAGKHVATWICNGSGGTAPGQGAHARWHITSTDLSERSFPTLEALLAAPLTHAVSFHGFRKKSASDPDIVIGGLGATALKTAIHQALVAVLPADLAVHIAQPGDDYAGMESHNVVNRLARLGGIQIEQSSAARTAHWATIATAVSSVYAEDIAAAP